MEGNLIGNLWRSQFIDRQVQSALLALMDDHNRLARLIRSDIPQIQPREIRAALERAVIDVSFPTISGQGQLSVSSTEPFTEEEQPPLKYFDVQLFDLLSEGLIRPPLALEKRYKGEFLSAQVNPDGTVTYDGTVYQSLSTAAAMARKSVIGKPPGRKYPQTNGWTFWKYLDPETNKWLVIDHLRQRLADER